MSMLPSVIIAIGDEMSNKIYKKGVLRQAEIELSFADGGG